MDTFQMANGSANTPDAIEEGRQDFFSPATPSNNRVHPYHQNDFYNFEQSQISSSPYSLRTQRSSSALSWSTVTSSDTNSISDFSDNASISTFPTSISPSSLMSSGRSSHGSGRKNSARMSSLSIDPKLFAPQPKDGGAEDEVLETARPKRIEKKLGAAAVVGLGEPSTKKKGKEDGKKKVSHARKQTADHIPRPRNAFILFRKHVVDAKLIPSSVETKHQNVSIITAKMWSEADPDTKAHFSELARVEKEEHMEKYPGYRYQPVYRRTNVIRRRVRKDEAEEEKCKNVAELLLKGKSGDVLEAEIKNKVIKAEAEPRPKAQKKSKAACELSKGALRALRAQSRQRQLSSDSWSDISRATSIGPEASIHTRKPSLAGSVEQSHSPQDSGLAYEFMPRADRTQIRYTSEDVALEHLPWGEQIASNLPSGVAQPYIYPTANQPDMIHHIHQQSQPMASSSSGQHFSSQEFFYPQPHTQLSFSEAPNDAFYQQSASLPFSSPENHFTFQSQNDMSMEKRFAFDAAAEHQQFHPPMSARWDGGHFLPHSSEVPLEGLPFDDGGLMLGDFENALAQADDMFTGVW